MAYFKQCKIVKPYTMTINSLRCLKWALNFSLDITNVIRLITKTFKSRISGLKKDIIIPVFQYGIILVYFQRDTNFNFYLAYRAGDILDSHEKNLIKTLTAVLINKPKGDCI
jgi:hypothetical protein